MKLRTQYNFHKVFVVSAIVIGIGFFLFSLIYSEIKNRSAMEILNQERKGVLGVPGQPTVPSSEATSDVGIGPANSTHENLDVTESRNGRIESYGDEANSETLLMDSNDETRLSYEEELKQRYHRIRRTPEYQELNAQVYAVQIELEELGNLDRPADDAWVKFLKNRYSILGLTEAEADEIDLSDEQHEFISQEGKRLEEEAIEERDFMQMLYQENRRRRAELDRDILKLLGMTKEEVLMVLGRR